MKKTKRYSALLLSLLLLLLFALFSACGDTEQADDSGQTSDRQRTCVPRPTISICTILFSPEKTCRAILSSPLRPIGRFWTEQRREARQWRRRLPLQRI